MAYRVQGRFWRGDFGRRRLGDQGLSFDDGGIINADDRFARSRLRASHKGLKFEERYDDVPEEIKTGKTPTFRGGAGALCSETGADGSFKEGTGVSEAVDWTGGDGARDDEAVAVARLRSGRLVVPASSTLTGSGAWFSLLLGTDRPL